MSKVAVIGAGNGGLAVAGHFALRGHEVRLMDVNPAALEPIAQAGLIHMTGKISGAAEVQSVTAEAGEAVRGADLIMIVVPGPAHGAVAEALAPHVTERHTLVLHPGGAGGAFEFLATFQRVGVKSLPLIAEVESFMYGSKIVSPGHVQIGTVKLHDRIAALPASDTPRVHRLLQDDYPQFVPAKSVLQTSLNHMNAMLHVAGMVMNAGWIETTQGGFEFYRDGLSPTVARIIEGVDSERMNVSRALGADATSLRDWIRETYHVEGPSLFETLQTLNATVYKTSKAPESLGSRYLSEDVPTGIVPIAALGEAAGTALPLARSLIQLSSAIHQTDHWRTGRTLEKMGLAGKTLDAIVRAADTGL
jgi:opine dehydrogenase